MIWKHISSFFDKLQNSSWEEETVWTYYITKLTEEEMKLVKQKDRDHFMSYYDHAEYRLDPDVSKKEMGESESKPNLVRGSWYRDTSIFNVESMKWMINELSGWNIGNIQWNKQWIKQRVNYRRLNVGDY